LPSRSGLPTQEHACDDLVLLLAPFSINGVGQPPREILHRCRNATLARRASKILLFPTV